MDASCDQLMSLLRTKWGELWWLSVFWTLPCDGYRP